MSKVAIKNLCCNQLLKTEYIYLIFHMTNAIIGKFISRNSQQNWWSYCSVRFRLFICTQLVTFPLIMRLAVVNEPRQVLV